MHSTDPSTPSLFLHPHYIFKAWVGSFPLSVSSQLYVVMCLWSQVLHHLTGIPLTASERGSIAQHILCHAGWSTAFGTGKSLVQGHASPSSAQSLPPWSQALRVSDMFKGLLHLPSLPPSAVVLINRSSCPWGCKITALTSHISETWREKEENEEENIKLKSGHYFCCFKVFVLSSVSLSEVSIVILVGNGVLRSSLELISALFIYF